MKKTLYIFSTIVGSFLLMPFSSFAQSSVLTGKWQLSYIKDTLLVAPNGAARPDNGVQLTFQDNGITGHFTGTFYCNGVVGDYAFGNNSIMKVAGRDTTNNPCYDEKRLWVYFSRISNYKIVGNTVVFIDNNGTDKLIFTKVPVLNSNNQNTITNSH